MFKSKYNIQISLNLTLFKKGGFFNYDSAFKEFYIISGGHTSIDRFTKQGKYIETIFKGNKDDFLAFITLNNQGVIYCTSSTNNKIYKLRRK